ncbi:hypothetical protein MMC20_005237 [Loxospora ochrophaea]|nr:hypothetical protein [Loxospora ochrophaea]
MPRGPSDAPLALPSLTDDPSERRRLLNVLAQRRYRNRKRARLATLESQLQNSSNDTASVTASSIPEDEDETQVQDLSSNFEPEIGNFLDPNSIEFNDADTGSPQSRLPHHLSFDSSALTGLDQSFTPSLSLDFGLGSLNGIDPTGFGMSEGDFSLAQEYPDQAQSSSEATQDNPFHPSRGSSSSTGERRAPTRNMLSAPDSFADETFINAPELSLLHAHSTIVQRIQLYGCKIELWNLHSTSPFYQLHNPPLPTSPLLPSNYHPTPLQKRFKHHPVLDLLPWPSVRSRILYVLNLLPVDMRPPVAREDNMANVIMRLILDMKDSVGGIRVQGTDPFDETNWELGQQFFENWWWAFDINVVRNSNLLRRRRGEGVLRLGTGEQA